MCFGVGGPVASGLTPLDRRKWIQRQSLSRFALAYRLLQRLLSRRHSRGVLDSKSTMCVRTGTRDWRTCWHSSLQPGLILREAGIISSRRARPKLDSGSATFALLAIALATAADGILVVTCSVS